MELPRRGLGQRARRDEHDFRRRNSDRVGDACRDGGADRIGPDLDARLRDDDDGFTAAAARGPEGDHVAGAHAVDVGDRALDVFGKHVAAADDDDVLAPSADHDFTVDEVSEVSGAEPSVVDGRRRRFGVAEIARSDRVAAEFDLTDLAVDPRRARVGVDHSEFEPVEHPTEARESPCTLAALFDRCGVAVRLQHPAVDRIHGHAGAGLGEADRQGGFGHAVHAERDTGIEPEGRAGCEERLDRIRIDGFGAIEGEPPPREIEIGAAPKRTRREGVGEVRAARDRAPERGHPLQPAAGRGEEILWTREHEVDAVGHRDAEQTDQAHVVVQREP